MVPEVPSTVHAVFGGVGASSAKSDCTKAIDETAIIANNLVNFDITLPFNDYQINYIALSDKMHL
jgi:hypothetical protein